MGRSLSTAEALLLYYNPNGGKSQEKIENFTEQRKTAKKRQHYVEYYIHKFAFRK